MVVVIGRVDQPRGGPGEPDGGGRAGGIAAAVAGSGVAVELVARVDDDSAGDALLMDLARRRVGHAAVIRQPVGGPTEQTSDPYGQLDAADIELALRYLPGYVVIVVTDSLSPASQSAVAAGAAFAGAHLVWVGSPAAVPEEADPAVTILEPPLDERDRAFASFVAAQVARIARSRGAAFPM